MFDAFERALQGTLSREPDPQPLILWRGAMRGRRLLSECAVCTRNIHPANSAEREPSAPLDSRGWANCPLAACRGVPGLDGKATGRIPLSGCPDGRFSQSSVGPRIGGVGNLVCCSSLDRFVPGPWLWTLAVIEPFLNSPGMASFSGSVFRKNRAMCGCVQHLAGHGALGRPALSLQAGL